MAQGREEQNSSLPLTWETWDNLKYGEQDLEPFRILGFKLAQEASSTGKLKRETQRVLSYS